MSGPEKVNPFGGTGALPGARDWCSYEVNRVKERDVVRSPDGIKAAAMPGSEMLLEQAMAKELWQNTYAAENHDEYWAEGVQSWLDCIKVPTTGLSTDNASALPVAFISGFTLTVLGSIINGMLGAIREFIKWPMIPVCIRSLAEL